MGVKNKKVKTTKTLRKKNLSVANVILNQMNNNVQNTDLNSKNLNVNSAVRLPSGFVGETLTFVIIAISKCVKIRSF